MRLKGKRAIVTGGASGFGEGIVRKFAEQGASVLIADLNGEAGQALAEQLSDAPGNDLNCTIKAITTNVADDQSMQQMKEAAIEQLGGIDILVNNAGTTHLPALMEEVTTSDFDKVLNVNCKSVYLAAKHIVPVFKKQGHGTILNIASTAAVSPRPKLSWYNASKGWMNTATQSMAIELAPHGIRVNALNPVAGETPLLKMFMGEDTPEVRAKFLATIPLGRFSTPSDMGNAACYLCSDEASMVTGVCMEVDGGRCI